VLVTLAHFEAIVAETLEARAVEKGGFAVGVAGPPVDHVFQAQARLLPGVEQAMGMGGGDFLEQRGRVGGRRRHAVRDPFS